MSGPHAWNVVRALRHGFVLEGRGCRECGLLPVDVDDALAPADFDLPVVCVDQEPRPVVVGNGRVVAVRDRLHLIEGNLRLLEDGAYLLGLALHHVLLLTTFVAHHVAAREEITHVVEIPPFSAPFTDGPCRGKARAEGDDPIGGYLPHLRGRKDWVGGGLALNSTDVDRGSLGDGRKVAHRIHEEGPEQAPLGHAIAAAVTGFAPRLSDLP